MLPQPTLYRNYVDGRFAQTGKTFPNISPVDGKELGQVCEADAALVDRAVRAARAAVEGPWGKTSAAERASVLRAIADGIERRFDDFVAAEVADTGRPAHQARALDIRRGVQNFRTFAELVGQAGSEYFDMRTADGDDVFSYVVRKPHGVVAIISPWTCRCC
ncbi:2-hydroxymuconic semialdehyde dehydrogenase (fragment) [Cupriavidus necator]|uniref:2-hydroxymuconic semialdehyde dehydrogenase n=1 Tax=Cupriavidus necator TaxID=106590 RepID=A0A1K0J6B4_CUPNE